MPLFFSNKVSKTIAFSMLLCVVLASCSSRKGRYYSESSSFEHLYESDQQWFGWDNKLIVGKLAQVDESVALSGKKSVLVDPSNPFALNVKFSKVATDEYILVDLQFKGSGELVLVASHTDADVFYRKSVATVSPEDDWKHHRLEMSVPPTMDGEDLNFYIWNPGQGKIWVDNLELTFLEEKIYPDYDPLETIHIFIDSLELIQLDRKRTEAFENGILETAEDDYVDGIMFYRDTIIPIDLRLKGDWLDHLEGRKWSFRIKVKKEYTWNHIKTFSIHNPAARHFMDEWVAHELYRRNDLLAPRYGFVPVTVNGKSLGIYAWEEHFEKQLLESLNRREGPILKFSENHFWTIQKLFKNEGVYYPLPVLQSADILPFKQSRTLADTNLREQYLIGRKLMNQYRYGTFPISDIFDVGKLAGYQALMDLTRGFHGITWHNQRTYYNPVIGKLEPIFFDGYTEEGVFNPERESISGLLVVDTLSEKKFENLFWARIFEDSLFVSEYENWLQIVSDPSVVEAFLDEYKSQIVFYEKQIQKEFPLYKFDSGFIKRNAARIALDLKKFSEFVSNGNAFPEIDKLNIEYERYFAEPDVRLLPDFIKAYRDTVNSINSVTVRNFFPQDVWIIGVSESASRSEVKLDQPILLRSSINGVPSTAQITASPENTKIWLLSDQENESFQGSIQNIPSPDGISAVQNIIGNLSLELPDQVQIEKGRIVFPSEQIIIDHAVVIPSGYQVVFEPGSKVDFIRGSFFLSYSPVFLQGTSDSIIQITSSDLSARGFTVIQAKDTSYLSFADFSGLNTMTFDGWQLTGAVNFYESHVNIDRTRFSNNQCEDALNIIRSEFSVSNSSFEDIYADAFDSDFCHGLVESVDFSNIGNDAIDFSGSQVIIRNCVIENAGDKGVSCGEDSELLVENTRVSFANIAYASKDLSVLNLQNCEAVNATYGLLAFQKKPEYGPARIEAHKFESSGIDTLHLIEISSRLKLNSSLINGQHKQVAKRFYAP